MINICFKSFSWQILECTIKSGKKILQFSKQKLKVYFLEFSVASITKMYKITILIKIDKYFFFMFGKSRDCQQNLKMAFQIIRATSFVPFVVPPCVTAITKVTHEVNCSYYYYIIFKPASRRKRRKIVLSS